MLSLQREVSSLVSPQHFEARWCFVWKLKEIVSIRWFGFRDRSIRAVDLRRGPNGKRFAALILAL
jgi:hypothetical protein